MLKCARERVLSGYNRLPWGACWGRSHRCSQSCDWITMLLRHQQNFKEHYNAHKRWSIEKAEIRLCLRKTCLISTNNYPVRSGSMRTDWVVRKSVIEHRIANYSETTKTLQHLMSCCCNERDYQTPASDPLPSNCHHGNSSVSVRRLDFSIDEILRPDFGLLRTSNWSYFRFLTVVLGCLLFIY